MCNRIIHWVITVLMVDPLASSWAGLPLAVARLPHQRLHCRLFHCLRGSLLLLQAADHRPGQHHPLLRIHLNHGSYILPVLWWVLNKSLCRWSWLIIHAVTSFFPWGREGSKCVFLIFEMISLCLKSIFYLWLKACYCFTRYDWILWLFLVCYKDLQRGQSGLKDKP